MGWLSGLFQAGVARDCVGRIRIESFVSVTGVGVTGLTTGVTATGVVGLVVVTTGDIDADHPPPPHPELPLLGLFAVSERVVGVLVFPAGSLRVMLRVLDPVGSVGDGVTENVPVGHTTVVPMMVPPAFLMITVDPTSPVPVMVGVRVGTVELFVGDVIVGALGAVVSTIGVRGVELLVQLVGTIGSHALTVIGSGVDGIAVVGIE
jgi:hypothetical protein